ncbi:MAG: hypothetical protein AAF645_30075, partial [Myxococcota bacterium]
AIAVAVVDGFCETSIGSDAANCGACGNDCASLGGVADAVCASGRCIPLACQAGFEDCDRSTPDCETNVNEDATNCGRCDNVCGEGGTCVAGDCECADGQRFCDGGCTDTQSDANNCGGCNVRCGADQSCTDGRCECSDGLAACGESCIDPLDDNSNCGECGNVCPGTSTCTGGFCQCASADERLCGPPLLRSCVNVRDNNENCGDCGSVCRGGQSCTGFACECPPGEDFCGRPGEELCTPLRTVDNCGFCGDACPDGASCSPTGFCDCGAGRGVCETFPGSGVNECRDFGTNTDCGGCDDACIGGSTCNGTVCECGFGEALCGAPGMETCIDVNMDPLNCGGCGIDCGVGGSCSGGLCDGVMAVALGAEHTCAIRGNGNVVCWGDNQFGQSAPGTPAPTVPPTQILLPFAAIEIAAGDGHSCALIETDIPGVREVWCWGDNSEGQLGRTTPAPLDVTPIPEVPLQLDAGAAHSCAIVAGGAVFCWGSETFGRTGPGPMAGPAVVTGASGVDIVLGADTSFVATDTGGASPIILAWGSSLQNQL